MSQIDIYDPSLDQDCTSCEDVCKSDGCDKLILVGPCDAIMSDTNADNSPSLFGYRTPDNMIFNDSQWCRLTHVNSMTYNPNLTIRQKGYVGQCFETTKVGRKRPTLELDIDYCKFEDSHCILNQPGCLISWMCMDDNREFVANISPEQLPSIRYGVARVSAPTETSNFDEEDNRTFTLTVHQYMWEFNMCPGGFHDNRIPI